MDRRDSLGVCVDNQKGAESLQRDQAVCISTNGTLTHTHARVDFPLLYQSWVDLIACAVCVQAPSLSTVKR